MEVFGVLVQHETTELLHGELLARPDLGDIKGIKAKLFWVRVLGLHDLYHGSPFNVFASLDSLPQVTLGVVRIFATHLCSLFLGELLLATFGDEMILDVDEFAFSIHPLKSMAAVAVVVPPANGSAVVAEEHQTSVVALRCVCKEVEQRIVVGKEVLGVARLRADNIRSLNRITAKEDGLDMLAWPRNGLWRAHKVKANDVVVALHGVELDGHATRVASLIRILAANSHGRKANEGRSLLTNASQEVSFLPLS